MKKILYSLLFASVMFAACNKTPAGTEPVTGPISISPLLTRAMDTSFENGDIIGLSVLRNGDEPYADNSPYVFENNVFTGSLTWYQESDVPSDFIAYYPYDEAGVPESFSVQTDQSQGTSSSDFIIGVERGIVPTASVVDMTFRHVLSKIVIDMTNDTGSDITSVVISGSKTTAAVNVAEASVTVSGSAATEDITTCEITENESYAAILVPQEAVLTIKVKTSGNEYSQVLESAELVQGGQHRITARISEESGLQIKIAGAIEDWTDAGEIGPGGDEPGEENSITYDGVTYRTVTFANGQTWMAEPLRYIPEGLTPSTDPAADSHIWYPYKNDGTGAAVAATDEETIAAKGYLYDLYAAFGVEEGGITADNCYEFEGTQGICPDGWHIPTKDEFMELCGTASGGGSNPDALFYDAVYDGGKITTFNENGWNFSFSGWMQKTSITGTGKYSGTWIDSNKSTVEEFHGNPTLNYVMTSTCYKPVTSSTGEVTNIQYFSLMSTFTSKYPEGRLTLAYGSFVSGQELRCIKD